MLTQAQIAQYHRDGFLLVKAVLSPEEMAAMQAAGRAMPIVREVSTHLFSIPGLSKLWQDRRLIGIAKDLLGDGCTFYAETHYTRYVFNEGQHIEGRHVHHDAKGTLAHLFNRLHDVLPQTYPGLQLAVYFQNTARQSGGLKVVPGSHKMDTTNFDPEALDYFDVPSEPGDVVCFSGRCLHSPFSLRLRDDPDRTISPNEEDRLFPQRPEIFLPTPTNRETIFVNFAGEDLYSDLLVKSRANHPSNLKSGVVTALDALGLEKAASEAGVRLRMDHALSEALEFIGNNLVGRDIKPEAVPFVSILPRLARLSPQTSVHHGLFTRAPEDDRWETAIALANEMFEARRRNLKMLHTIRPDPSMKSLKPYETPQA